MKYAEKYGVSRAIRKYNKSRSYTYFRKRRWDGSTAFLTCQSKQPHSHPNQHTEAELKLIRDMRRRNPQPGMIELWHRLRQRSHREDQKRFCSVHSFCSLDDFAKQLAVHNRRSNNLPMRPLHWRSPAEATAQYA